MYALDEIASAPDPFLDAVRMCTAFRPLYVKLKIVFGCNLKCEMCNHWRESRGLAMKTEKFKEIISDLAELGCRKVHFTGGEPMLRGDIPELVAHAHGLGIRVCMTSNGTLIDKEKAKALVEAHQRGVHVEAILDRSQESEKYSSADFVLHAGIPTMIDAKHAIAHNKVIIIDGGIVITGSFNFTKAAEEHNAENLLVIRDRQIAEKYTANWQLHAAHSKEYTGIRDMASFTSSLKALSSRFSRGRVIYALLKLSLISCSPEQTISWSFTATSSGLSLSLRSSR